MTIRRQPLHRHVLTSLIFLLVVLAFFTRYLLIWSGVVDNQVVPPRKRAGEQPAPARVLPRNRCGRFQIQARETTSAIEGFAKTNALLRIPFSEFNMDFRKLAGMRLFPDADNTLRLNNGYLSTPRGPVDASYCGKITSEFSAFCAERGIPFLYVVLPTKSAPDASQVPFGMEDHGYANADRLVKSLTENGVPVLDLREIARIQFTNYYDLFFRTDHHWKPESGLWAAGLIVDELNRRYDLGLSREMLDPAKYDVRVLPRFFLGSLGKKVTKVYAPPDDFSVISPTFATSFGVVVPPRKRPYSGSFREVLLPDKKIGTTNYYRANPYAAYCWGDQPCMTVSNHLQAGGKRLLVIKDSFANVVSPFLAVVAGSLDVLDLRYYSGGACAYVEQHKPDAVIILYNAGNICGAGSASRAGSPFNFQLPEGDASPARP